jgi:hypothetical protein
MLGEYLDTELHTKSNGEKLHLNLGCAWTLILQMEEYMWLKSPTNDFAPDAQMHKSLCRNTRHVKQRGKKTSEDQQFHSNRV